MRCGSMRREGGESWLALEQEQGSFVMSGRGQPLDPGFTNRNWGTHAVFVGFILMERKS